MRLSKGGDGVNICVGKHTAYMEVYGHVPRKFLYFRPLDYFWCILRYLSMTRSNLRLLLFLICFLRYSSQLLWLPYLTLLKPKGQYNDFVIKFIIKIMLHVLSTMNLE